MARRLNGLQAGSTAAGPPFLHETATIIRAPRFMLRRIQPTRAPRGAPNARNAPAALEGGVHKFRIWCAWRYRTPALHPPACVGIEIFDFEGGENRIHFRPTTPVIPGLTKVRTRDPWRARTTTARAAIEEPWIPGSRKSESRNDIHSQHSPPLIPAKCTPDHPDEILSSAHPGESRDPRTSRFELL